MNGVSIVVPAYNAERTLGECLQSVTRLRWTGEIEIIVVDDGSTDKTAEIAASFSGVGVIGIAHGGAARATNTGIKAAHHDMVVLFDADALPGEDWLEKITLSFTDPSVVAVSGCAETANTGCIGKVAGYDAELRLGKVASDIDYLSTMNVACRREALLKAGLNEALKAGYDVDLTRRLKADGCRLLLRKDVRCRHYWKDNLRDYLRQQYGYAYCRLELARYSRSPRDEVAGWWMILQAPFTMLVLLLATFGTLISPWALLLLFLLPLIHLPETIILLDKKKDGCIALLPLLFTVRNLIWVWAGVRWGVSKVFKCPRSDSNARHAV